MYVIYYFLSVPIRPPKSVRRCVLWAIYFPCSTKERLEQPSGACAVRYRSEQNTSYFLSCQTISTSSNIFSFSRSGSTLNIIWRHTKISTPRFLFKSSPLIPHSPQVRFQHRCHRRFNSSHPYLDIYLLASHPPSLHFRHYLWTKWRTHPHPHLPPSPHSSPPPVPPRPLSRLQRRWTSPPLPTARAAPPNPTPPPSPPARRSRASRPTPGTATTPTDVAATRRSEWKRSSTPSRRGTTRRSTCSTSSSSSRARKNSTARPSSSSSGLSRSRRPARGRSAHASSGLSAISSRMVPRLSSTRDSIDNFYLMLTLSSSSCTWSWMCFYRNRKLINIAGNRKIFFLKCDIVVMLLIFILIYFSCFSNAHYHHWDEISFPAELGNRRLVCTYPHIQNPFRYAVLTNRIAWKLQKAMVRH